MVYAHYCLRLVKFISQFHKVGTADASRRRRLIGSGSIADFVPASLGDGTFEYSPGTDIGFQLDLSTSSTREPTHTYDSIVNFFFFRKVVQRKIALTGEGGANTGASRAGYVRQCFNQVQ